MFDWIPLRSYAAVFDYAILIMILIAFWQCAAGIVYSRDTRALNAGWGMIFTTALILYMGMRPISGVFGDTINYASEFNRIQAGSKSGWAFGKEWLFSFLFTWFAKYSNLHAFFTLCSAIYVGSLWLAMRRIFKEYYYIPLLVIFCMFTFWTYGVNGIRNGMGASLFILAMTYVNNPLVMITLAICAAGLHTSVYLMIACAALAWFVKNSYYFLAAWIACVIISYFAGFTIQNILANLSIFGGEDRFSGYLTYSHEQMVNDGFVVEMRFRWDFILYSALGVVVGYYFIFKRKYQDEYYHWIYNTYLATNAFWVLVIRAAYSNRFAQISWFILPIVLIYPFMKKRFWQNHERMLGYAIVLFYAYTFLTVFVI